MLGNINVTGLLPESVRLALLKLGTKNIAAGHCACVRVLDGSNHIAGKWKQVAHDYREHVTVTL
jgi:hypothetical protein